MQPIMFILLPFIVLMCLLFLTRNSLISILGAISAVSYLIIVKKNYTVLFFLENILKTNWVSIFSPSGYLFPLLILVIITFLLTLFEELKILDSYTLMMSKSLSKTSNFFFSVLLLCSPLLFFLDDYLSVLGIKNFFAPLVKDTQENKNKLTAYTVFFSGSGSLLFFLSTWVAVIVTQIKSIQHLVPLWENKSAIEIFSAAKPYFFYPIILYIFSIIQTISNGKNNFIFKKESTHQHILWQDIFIFLLLPVGIITAFIYQIIINGNALHSIDVSEIMFYGSLISFSTVSFFTFLFKSITLSFFSNLLKKTILDLFLPILTLSSCWLFSKLIVLVMNIQTLTISQSFHAYLYPLFYFLLSAIIALILGSEWGTFGITISLIPVANSFSNPSVILGAIISGTLCGAHLTPLSNIHLTASTIFAVDPMKAYFFRIKNTALLATLTGILYLALGFFY